MTKKILAKLNSSKPFGYVKDLEEKLVSIDGKEVTIFEFILEIPIDDQIFNKLVYVKGSQANRCRDFLCNEMCVHLQGRHIPCPYETERSQYLTELGILEIFTFDWELNYRNKPKTKAQSLAELRKEKQTKSNNKPKKSKTKYRDFNCDRTYFD